MNCMCTLPLNVEGKDVLSPPTVQVKITPRNHVKPALSKRIRAARAIRSAKKVLWLKYSKSLHAGYVMMD